MIEDEERYKNVEEERSVKVSQFGVSRLLRYLILVMVGLWDLTFKKATSKVYILSL